MAVMTATLTQDYRQFKVTSQLGKDVLLFSRMTATERVSGLFEISLDLWSKDGAIDVRKILGTPMGVAIESSPSGASAVSMAMSSTSPTTVMSAICTPIARRCVPGSGS